MRVARLSAVFIAASLWVGCGDDAVVLCDRLDACGCLSESTDSCAERIEALDETQLELCAHCVETQDYLCHEMAANHGGCRTCTDDFASPDVRRDPQQDGRGSVDGRQGDVAVSCVPR